MRKKQMIIPFASFPTFAVHASICTNNSSSSAGRLILVGDILIYPKSRMGRSRREISLYDVRSRDCPLWTERLRRGFVINAGGSDDFSCGYGVFRFG